MKRSLIIPTLAATAALLTFAAPAIADPSGAENDKGKGHGHTPVTVCHVLGNGGYNQITIDEEALDAHLAHGDTLPVDGACPSGDDTEPQEPETPDSPVEDSDPHGPGESPVEGDDPGRGDKTPTPVPDPGAEPDPEPEPTDPDVTIPDPITEPVTDECEWPYWEDEGVCLPPDGSGDEKDAEKPPASDTGCADPALDNPDGSGCIVFDCSTTVTYGDVDQVTWDYLRYDLGWKGDPTDGAERLYCPDHEVPVIPGPKAPVKEPTTEPKAPVKEERQTSDTPKVEKVQPVALVVDAPEVTPDVVTDGPRETLPETGVTTSMAAIIAAALTLAGAGLLRLTRRGV